MANKSKNKHRSVNTTVSAPAASKAASKPVSIKTMGKSFTTEFNPELQLREKGSGTNLAHLPVSFLSSSWFFRFSCARVNSCRRLEVPVRQVKTKVLRKGECHVSHVCAGSS